MKMRISKLMMPALTLAGALALAGCGGGSGTPVASDDDDDDNVVTKIQCQDGTEVTAPATCPTVAAESAFAKAGGTPGALLIASGANAGTLNRAAEISSDSRDATHGNFGSVTTAAFNKAKILENMHGSENPGMTWFEALGAEEVSLTIDDAAGNGYALKVTGEDIADFNETSSDDVGLSEKGDVFGAAAGGEITYKGFGGVLICNGNACNINSDNELTGDWYFQARSATAATTDTTLWVKKGKEYVPRSGQPHADWGVWLTDVDSEGPGKQIEWYASGSPINTLALRTVTGLSNTATYEGPAVGVSTLSATEDEDAKVGSFTADAYLEATFADVATNSTLEGTISGFKGDAVNTNWELTLQKTLLTAAGALGPGTEGTDGINRDTKVGSVSISDTWNAQLYGEANSRPSGVVGEFDGRFDDGQAVGVFHAK